MPYMASNGLDKHQQACRYTLQPGRLQWSGHNDSNAAEKDVGSILAAEVYTQDVFPLQIRLSVSWGTNSLLVKISQKDVFGRLECNKSAALQQVEYWDQVESERSLIEEEISIKKEAKEGYAKWVNLEEIHWRQLLRELWLREGDRNTGYFHRMATAHRRRNSLDRIKINGVWLSEGARSKDRDCRRFKQLLTKDLEWKADIGGLNLNQISQQEAEILEFPFSKDEVHSALVDMNGDKAPGPDDFTVAFWQCCWGVRERGDFRDVEGVP
ncbi:hypothetical protein CK203_056540 [Vitis vinifera]|uniref:Uncharacterized protein n=1 Tax=Vitis vinifera TaxID=29760 RepID=A0A438GKE0_VITVI|nr:hypothetical protein CK203_056540 [Vitis vinifera]